MDENYSKILEKLSEISEVGKEEEDKIALPFVGPAGHVLDKLLTYIGLRREDIYICNVIKCACD